MGETRQVVKFEVSSAPTKFLTPVQDYEGCWLKIGLTGFNNLSKVYESRADRL
jgi:hypothetical protein